MRAISVLSTGVPSGREPTTSAEMPFTFKLGACSLLESNIVSEDSSAAALA